MVQPGEGDGSALKWTLTERQGELFAHFVGSFDEARRSLKFTTFDAVLICPGLKQLSLASFLRSLPSPEPRVLVIGQHLPDGAPERIADQLFALLGIERSATFDAKVLETLGLAGSVEFQRVEWPGATEPLVRAQVSRSDFEASALAHAQRAGQLSGPGLAQTLEVFWDDPRPHLLQAVPPGVSLKRLVRQKTKWGVEVGLSIGRGLAEGIATLHAAGFSAGTLRPPSIWLTDAGDVLLLGHGLTQLPYTRQTYYGLPSEAPPEEYGTQLPPLIPGDAFRLGIAIMQLAVADSPVSQLSPINYLSRQWRPELDEHRDAFGRATPIIEQLLQAESVDRPRGPLLLALLERIAPTNARAILRETVAWSRSKPESPWA